MEFAPLGSFRYTKGSSAIGPAIILPARGRDNTMLVTGGEEPMFCFLDGPYAGDGFPAASAGNFSGLAFENVEFHVDWSSKFEYNLVEIPLGSLIVHDGGVDLVVAIKNNYRMDDAQRFPLTGSTSSSDRSKDIGFSKWKALQRQDGKLVEIFLFQSTRTADA